jgi:hypothetical protein
VCERRNRVSDTSVRAIADYLFGKLSSELGDDRIIPVREGQIAYVDTEACEVYLVTVERARFVPVSPADTTEAR